MLKDLEWFLDRVGLTVIRNNTEIEITSDAMAEKLFNIQDKDYYFVDKPRIHRAPMASCLSCEG